ncbi:5578_t:CDS:2 [Cetraspora pellucida]|uniref:5578_t:CDS:1 n=1 Tax=Cetraspora pellucida TaxID=1433469 RepID=A0A9N8YW20_9GLOM|nr:5578_t:CDS:2 [Cetraspora pellucida]
MGSTRFECLITHIKKNNQIDIDILCIPKNENMKISISDKGYYP